MNISKKPNHLFFTERYVHPVNTTRFDIQLESNLNMSLVYTSGFKQKHALYAKSVHDVQSASVNASLTIAVNNNRHNIVCPYDGELLCLFSVSDLQKLTHFKTGLLRL